MYVLDGNLNPVPVGVTGELYTAGAGLARGYLNRPDLTAERFLPDPHALVPSTRMYRTGDLTRWRPDGALEFLGRVDQQVKIRGFRIELGEVEAALKANRQVAQAAVIATEGGLWGRRLIAYVAPASGAVLEINALRYDLAERLPDYMLPEAFVLLDALPLTASGKLERKALPVPPRPSPEPASFVPPSSELEQAITRVWRQVLGLQRVGVHDNFFDLGGHSLAMVRTSLVAVHFACQSLFRGECEVAIAGACSIAAVTPGGYFYQESGILSPDGHCRAFDAAARGTVPSSAVGVVVLKRLDKALAHSDQIRAVIKGSAVNNDGASKVGYTAPSVEGQRRVIEAALVAARLKPHQLTCIEAHGTGTPLGDAIEVTALRQVFARGRTPAKSCALGSVKTNIGHCDAAAGMAGLIKTVLCLEHRTLVPSLHFKRPIHNWNSKTAHFMFRPGARLGAAPDALRASVHSASAAPMRMWCSKRRPWAHLRVPLALGSF